MGWCLLRNVISQVRHQRVSSSIRGFADLPGNLRLHGEGPQVAASPFDRLRDHVVRQLGALSVGDRDVIVPEELERTARLGCGC